MKYLYARRRSCPYYPNNPKGFEKKLDIYSDKYYDFMLYSKKIGILDLLRYRLVYICTETEMNRYGY